MEVEQQKNRAEQQKDCAQQQKDPAEKQKARLRCFIAKAMKSHVLIPTAHGSWHPRQTPSGGDSLRCQATGQYPESPAGGAAVFALLQLHSAGLTDQKVAAPFKQCIDKDGAPIRRRAACEGLPARRRLPPQGLE